MLYNNSIFKLDPTPFDTRIKHGDSSVQIQLEPSIAVVRANFTLDHIFYQLKSTIL
jgi:hypothetical protein